ncbi:MAG TPA: cation-transporting P-type ATPase [Candidatus Nanopusillus sp.]|nr:cation-transporting P-type ATPase [Candidatus Nanopusillus sp.]
MWHALPIDKVLSMLHTNLNGLPEEEVKRRRVVYGPNKIELKKKNLLLETIKEQIKSPLILLLIFSSVLAFYIGEYHEGILIMFVICLYTFFDFIQQYKSEKILSILKKESEGESIVRRDGKIKKIKASDLVPGDIVILKQGNKVPADIRIITARNLYVDESILTGESKPVKKENTVLPEDTPIQERKNMLFMGTFIVRGHAEGVVVATGNDTEIGKIYGIVETIEYKKTPLEKEIDKFGKLITVLTVLIIVLIFTLAYFSKVLSIYDSIIFAIALGVAVIPEGLPTILTIIYTIGLYKIYKAGALVKRLDSVETLGSVDVIFTDKTGTLTLNQLTVRKFWFNNKVYYVTGSGYSPEGNIVHNDKPVVLSEVFLFIEACLNSVESELIYDNGWKVIGDPLEGALISLAYKTGLKNRLEYINVFEFDQVRKRMSVVVKKGDRYLAFVKGAPEKILEISKYIYIGDKVVGISKYKKIIDSIIDKFAKEGYRLLAIGYKELNNTNDAYNLDKVEKDIVFLGIIAMEDPIREEVKDAIDFSKRANIDVIIITGDHPETAKIVAKKIGINSDYLLAKDIKKLSDERLVDLLKNKVKIIARADPSDKYRIVKAFKNKGYYTAMTGDGVNDAAALKLADIGISLADATDIAKESADMILLNNSFKSIIEAIKEGRRILYDLQTFLLIILSTNIALLINTLLSFFTLHKIILKATHILIINLALETVNSMVVGTNEISNKMLMKKPEKHFINKSFVLELIKHGLILGVFSYLLIAFLKDPSPFTIILYLALSRYIIFIYYQKKFDILFTKNKWFYVAIAISLTILLVSAIPPINKYTHLYLPDVSEILLSLVFVGLTYLVYLFLIYKEVKYQTVPEQHHQSANSDRHHKI